MPAPAPASDVACNSLVERISGGLAALNDAAAIFDWPATGDAPRLVFVNAAFESLFGYAAGEIAGRPADFLYGSSTDLESVAFLSDQLRATRQARGPVVYYRRDGVPVYVELSLRIVDAAGSDRDRYVAAMLRDVTTHKEFQLAIAKEKRKLQVTLAAIGDGVITTVADGRVDFVNLAARTLFGIDAAEAYGQPIAEALRLTDTSGATIDMLGGIADAARVSRGQALFTRGSAVKHIAYVTSSIAGEGYVMVLRDVTAQHRLATQLSYEASHDPLTGMYNRRKFDELLEDAIDGVVRGEGPHALAFLDLDRFKRINDTCGHAVGDRVLLDLAHLLQQQLRGRDVLARIGGDEFAILLHGCSLDNAHRVLDVLRQAVESYRLRYHNVEYEVGVSIGVTAIDAPPADAATLCSRADAACYAAKHSRSAAAER